LKSIENNQKALGIYQQLVTLDPQNKLLQQGIAIAYANVGTQAGVAGNKALSSESMDKSLNIMKDVVASSPQNVLQQGILAAIYEARGDNVLRWHQFQPAKREYERAFSAYEKINAGASNAGTQVSAAGCKSRMGSAALQAGEAETAAAAVVAPHMIRTLRSQAHTRTIPEPQPPSRPLFLRHLQPFASPDPLHSILPHLPSRALQQRRDAPVAVPPILSR
jgi:tetratricopeptide (TPR) repeat protein